MRHPMAKRGRARTRRPPGRRVRATASWLEERKGRGVDPDPLDRDELHRVGRRHRVGDRPARRGEGTRPAGASVRPPVARASTPGIEPNHPSLADDRHSGKIEFSKKSTGKGGFSYCTNLELVLCGAPPDPRAGRNLGLDGVANCVMTPARPGGRAVRLLRRVSRRRVRPTLLRGSAPAAPHPSRARPTGVDAGRD
jgi:hypothetical protein